MRVDRAGGSDRTPFEHGISNMSAAQRLPIRSGLAVQEGSDALIAVARPSIDQGPDAGQELGLAGPAISGSRPASAALHLRRELRRRLALGEVVMRSERDPRTVCQVTGTYALTPEPG